MEKEFYVGQQLIVKRTGENVTFACDDGEYCKVLIKSDYSFYGYYEYETVEPKTEFKFSEIIAGLEQGYFEVGTEFRMPNTDKTIKVEKGDNGLYLNWLSELLVLTPKDINSTWVLVESSKEMTLKEIEAELGYKVKLT